MVMMVLYTAQGKRWCPDCTAADPVLVCTHTHAHTHTNTDDR
jgi:hypothetical protein